MNLPHFLALYPAVAIYCCTVTSNANLNIYSTLEMQVFSVETQHYYLASHLHVSAYVSRHRLADPNNIKRKK